MEGRRSRVANCLYPAPEGQEILRPSFIAVLNPKRDLFDGSLFEVVRERGLAWAGCGAGEDVAGRVGDSRQAEDRGQAAEGVGDQIGETAKVKVRFRKRLEAIARARRQRVKAAEEGAVKLLICLQRWHEIFHDLRREHFSAHSEIGAVDVLVIDRLG